MQTRIAPNPTHRGANPSYIDDGYVPYGRSQLFAYAYYRLSREEAQKSESTSISKSKKNRRKLLQAAWNHDFEILCR